MKKKKSTATDSFSKVLAEDVLCAKHRMENEPSDASRREFARSTFSAIEAQYWQLKMYIVDSIITDKNASLHKISALREESYSINEKGEICVQPRGYSLKVGIRLIVSILKEHRISIPVDFGSSDWKNIDLMLRIRNRLTHPKCMADISITEEEAECCYCAFTYLNHLMIETIMGSAHAMLNDIMSGNWKPKRRSPSMFSSGN